MGNPKNPKIFTGDPTYKNDEGTGPKLDCSVGGLYYKIYADSHERRMAASIVIKPAHITHRKLHLQEENRNFPDTVSYMAAVKDTYLEKMLNTNPELSIQTFCNQVIIKSEIFEMIFEILTNIYSVSDVLPRRTIFKFTKN